MDWENIEGLRPLNPEEIDSLKEFARAMREETIPAIVEYEKRRQQMCREDRGPLF